MARPSLSVLQRRAPKSPGLSASLPTSHVTSTQSVPQYTGIDYTSPRPLSVADNETALMEQIALMRSVQEAHLASLREARTKEVASHLSYIAFLEARQNRQAVRQNSKQALTIDTSQTGSRKTETLQSDASATTLQSLESLESQKRSSHEAATEAEALKRKLSLYRKAQSESGDVRRERDHLRDSVERSDRRISQLKDIVRKSKDGEKSLKNAVADLEARLILANNERTDVLEGLHEASEKVRQLIVREQQLSRELHDLRWQHVNTTAQHPVSRRDSAKVIPRHQRTMSDAGALSLRDDPLMRQVQECRRQLAEKDSMISQFEDRQSLAHAESKARIVELEAALDEHSRMLATAQADCQRYNALLHGEIRRQSRYAVQKGRTPNAKIDDEASAAVQLRLDNLQAGASGKVSENDGSSAAVLEKETEHWMKEIIMYKLDVKGYKKDLRRANAEIESLQAVQSKRPITPDRDSSSSINSNSTDRHRETPAMSSRSADGSQPGLGIYVLESPSTPTRSLPSLASAASLAATPPMPLTAVSPAHRPKTPLGHHKKLPKPPVSRSPSPLLSTLCPGGKMERAETLRSLSESIISSYAKRSTPEQSNSLTPPVKERKTEPLKPLPSPGIVNHIPKLLAVDLI